MPSLRRILIIFIIVLILQASALASSPGLYITIRSSSGYAQSFSPPEYASLEKYRLNYNGSSGIPLERFLWKAGAYPVTGVITGSLSIDWADIAYCSYRDIPVLVDSHGGINAFGESIPGDDVFVATADKPRNSIMDIAPTVSEALGMQGGNYDGKSLAHVNASQVVVLYIDALGWYRYHRAKEMGITSNISLLGDPVMASSVYPSISVVNAAAIVTGVYPEKSGIDRWDNRTILVDTSLDLAKRSNVSAAWIDSMKPPISLKEGIINVPDEDSITDDEVIDRAISEHNKGMRLIYAHIAYTDKMLHMTGSYSQESQEAIAHADVLTGRLLEYIRPGTLVIIVADHGGHDIAGGMGDHGSLLPHDMLIPIFLKKY